LFTSPKMSDRLTAARLLLCTQAAQRQEEISARQARRAALEAALLGAATDAERRALCSGAEATEALIVAEKRKRWKPSDFESLRVLGRGAFGEVALVRCGGKLFAMKTLSRELPQPGPMAQHVAHVRAERDALAALNASPFIVSLFFSFQSSSGLHFVTEFAPGGDLMQVLIAQGHLSEPLCRLYAAELILAIAAVHGAGFIHRDVKPDNILLDASGHLLLTDLGLSTKGGAAPPPAAEPSPLEGFLLGGGPPPSAPGFLRSPRGLAALSVVGTPDYLAPEVLRAANSSAPYDARADLWSLGAVLYECLIGVAPFAAATPVATCQRILRWQDELRLEEATTARHLSAHAVGFLKALLCEAPERLGGSEGGATDLLAHPWFAGLDVDPAALKAVDVAALGGRPPGKGKMAELVAALPALPRDSPAFAPLLAEVCSEFDDFSALSPSDPRALVVHAVGGGEGGARTTPPLLGCACRDARPRLPPPSLPLFFPLLFPHSSALPAPTPPHTSPSHLHKETMRRGGGERPSKEEKKGETTKTQSTKKTGRTFLCSFP
jgi:serine/threonine kinase 38